VKLEKGDSNMRLKTKLLFIAALFVLTLPMVLTIGGMEANASNATIQGQVGIIDWCARTVFIDDVHFNMGTLDLVGVIRTGDTVQATYENTRIGKVIKSIRVIRGGENR
jgi:hypothetical protein